MRMEVFIVIAEGPVCFGVIGHVLLDVATCPHIVGLESIHMRFVLVVNHSGASLLGNGFDILSSKSTLISFWFLTL